MTKTTNIKPIGSTVLIEVIKKDYEIGGIVVKGEGKDENPCAIGKVIAVDKGYIRALEDETGTGCPIQEGVTVLFQGLAGSSIPNQVQERMARL